MRGYPFTALTHALVGSLAGPPSHFSVLVTSSETYPPRKYQWWCVPGMDTALNEDDDSSTSALSIRVSVPSRVTNALYTFLSEFPSVKSSSVIAAMSSQTFVTTSYNCRVTIFFGFSDGDASSVSSSRDFPRANSITNAFTRCVLPLDSASFGVSNVASRTASTRGVNAPNPVEAINACAATTRSGSRLVASSHVVSTASPSSRCLYPPLTPHHTLKTAGTPSSIPRSTKTFDFPGYLPRLAPAFTRRTSLNDRIDDEDEDEEPAIEDTDASVRHVAHARVPRRR